MTSYQPETSITVRIVKRIDRKRRNRWEGLTKDLEKQLEKYSDKLKRFAFVVIHPDDLSSN